MHLVPSIALSGIDTLIKQYGADSDQLMQDIGIDPAALKRPDHLIDGQLFGNLIEHAARQVNQRFFGIQLAQIQGITVLGPLWFLLRNSASVGQVIDNLIKNYPSHTHATIFSKEVLQEGTTLIYDVHSDINGDHTQIIELGLAIACITFRRYINPNWQPKAVYFKTVDPYEKRLLLNVFGNNLYFEQEINGILITPEQLALPIKHASQLQQQYYAHQLDKQRDFNPSSTLVQTEHIINASLTRHHCSLDYVAKCLEQKPRTLQHHLKQHGTSFQTLVQKAKLNLALRYLQQSNLSVTEISQRLKFSELAVFSRFIKKLTGQTPSQHRK